MYHIFYMKCNVLLVFSCVFTMFSLQKHVLLVHFTCLYENTHVPYILHEMHCFASVFMCFYCFFTAETCIFGTFHMYTKIPMYHIFYIKSTVLLVFSCAFTVFSVQKHVLFVYFTCIYQIHMYHIFYIKCTVLLVFSCVFTVFSLQKHEFLVHFI
jgi:hypothetical protein